MFLDGSLECWLFFLKATVDSGLDLIFVANKNFFYFFNLPVPFWIRATIGYCKKKEVDYPSAKLKLIIHLQQ